MTPAPNDSSLRCRAWPRPADDYCLIVARFLFLGRSCLVNEICELSIAQFNFLFGQYSMYNIAESGGIARKTRHVKQIIVSLANENNLFR